MLQAVFEEVETVALYHVVPAEVALPAGVNTSSSRLVCVSGCAEQGEAVAVPHHAPGPSDTRQGRAASGNDVPSPGLCRRLYSSKARRSQFTTTRPPRLTLAKAALPADVDDGTKEDELMVLCNIQDFLYISEYSRPDQVLVYSGPSLNRSASDQVLD